MKFYPMLDAERMAGAENELAPGVDSAKVIFDAVADVIRYPLPAPDNANYRAAMRLAALAIVLAERRNNGGPIAVAPPPPPVLKPWVISRANHAPTPLQGWRIYFQSISVPNGKLVETQDARQAATFTEEADATAVMEVIERTTRHTTRYTTRWDVVRQP